MPVVRMHAVLPTATPMTEKIVCDVGDGIGICAIPRAALYPATAAGAA